MVAVLEIQLEVEYSFAMNLMPEAVEKARGD
jgi:hypothetical protein